MFLQLLPLKGISKLRSISQARKSDSRRLHFLRVNAKSVPSVAEGQILPIYFCYILRCSDRSFYVGVTDDPARRLREHNGGRASKYTFSRRPVHLVWTEQHDDLASARRREMQLKRWGHAKKEKLAAGSPRLRP